MKLTSPFLSIIRPANQSFARKTSCLAILVALVLPISSLLAESAQFTNRDFTSSVESVTTVNVSELAKTRPSADVSTIGPEINRNGHPMLRPPVQNTGPVFSRVPSTPRAEASTAAAISFRGFNGLTHLDQRNARNGNQFSVEPPDQALAVGNGFVLEAINTALNVYDTNGIQKLARPLALTEFFGLPASINRTTGKFGVFAGDVVSLFDPETSRWFVLAFADLNKSDGTPLAQSRIFLGVSQTSDPRGVFTIYTLNTTDANDPDGAGPRIPDFPHIGLDHFGFFISVNEFSFATFGFIDAAIFAISKQALITGSGGTHPGVTRIALPFQTGFEFTVFPANTPPGSSFFTGNGGVEFFVSSQFVSNTEHSLSVWALTNTKSLDTIPALGLQRDRVSTQAYNFPTQSVEQKDGFRPLGASLNEPLETLDSGDFRVLSVVFSAGRLWATLGTEVTDGNGDQRMAAAFFALSPQIVGGTLSASVITQGVISETGASLLRPAIAVNAQNKGGMVFTLVGPNDFPSSAFVPIDDVTVGPINIARAGNEPEDGFSGYAAFGGNGTARWGDYSAAGVDSDGSIWMATEYIPDLARTFFANWSTYITRFQP